MAEQPPTQMVLPDLAWPGEAYRQRDRECSQGLEAECVQAHVGVVFSLEEDAAREY